jgi:hypothetical protein
MNRFKNHLITAAVLALLAGIGTIMNSLHPSVLQAAGGPAVTIDPTQLPLPVQGSVSVSGTVAATQSGPWNVGVTGTPNVKVANPATAPALTLDISKSASQHVELLCFATDICLAPTGGTAYQVPAGQNLVVTSVDILGSGAGNAGTFFSILIPNTNGGARWTVPNDLYTHSFQYPSGIVYPAGFVFNNCCIGVQNFFEAYVHGYLTPI